MADYSTFAVAKIPHGVMFHHFHGMGHPAVQGSIDAQQLADMIDFLGGHKRILDPQVWMDKTNKGQLDKDDLCLTFDDSLLCQIEVAAPVLKDLGHKAFFFVYSSIFQGKLERLEIYRSFRTTCFEDIDAFYDKFFEHVDQSPHGERYRSATRDFVPSEYLGEHPFYSDGDRKFRFVRDRVLDPTSYETLMDSMIEETTSIETLSKSLWMNNSDLVALASEGHQIGLHSYSHYTELAEWPRSVQESEYRLNFDHLAGVLDFMPQSVAHPRGSYNSDTLQILGRLGITLGFRASMTRPGETRLEYPREDHANIVGMMEQMDS